MHQLYALFTWEKQWKAFRALPRNHTLYLAAVVMQASVISWWLRTARRLDHNQSQPFVKIDQSKEAPKRKQKTKWKLKKGWFLTYSISTNEKVNTHLQIVFSMLISKQVRVFLKPTYNPASGVSPINFHTDCFSWDLLDFGK